MEFTEDLEGFGGLGGVRGGAYFEEVVDEGGQRGGSGAVVFATHFVFEVMRSSDS